MRKIRIIVLRRTKPLKYSQAVTIVSSLVTGVILYTAILAFIGVSPLKTLGIIAGSFTDPSLIKDFILLSLLGYALLVAFKGSLWNIGAEGQFYIAALPVVYVTTVLFYTSSTVNIAQAILIILVSIILAILFGAAWGALAGIIKAYAGVDEVPVTLVMNYIAYFLGNILILGPLMGKYVYGYKRTDMVPEAYRVSVTFPLPSTDPFTRLVGELVTRAWWILVLLLVVYLVRWLFNKTTLGLQIKVLGSNPDYLTTIGSDVKKVTVTTFAISGGLVGLVAALYILGYLYRLEYPLEGQTSGYGYIAILVTWLSLLRIELIPVSAYIVSSLFNAGLLQGSDLEVKEALRRSGWAGAELSFRWIMVGSILLTYSVLRFLSEYKVKVVWK